MLQQQNSHTSQPESGIDEPPAPLESGSDMTLDLALGRATSPEPMYLSLTLENDAMKTFILCYRMCLLASFIQANVAWHSEHYVELDSPSVELEPVIPQLVELLIKG